MISSPGTGGARMGSKLKETGIFPAVHYFFKLWESHYIDLLNTEAYLKYDFFSMH